MREGVLRPTRDKEEVVGWSHDPQMTASPSPVPVSRTSHTMGAGGGLWVGGIRLRTLDMEVTWIIWVGPMSSETPQDREAEGQSQREQI